MQIVVDVRLILFISVCQKMSWMIGDYLTTPVSVVPPENHTSPQISTNDGA